MSVPVAYVTVVLIWTTTPLAIIWSSEQVPPTLAAMSRMAIAAVCGLALLRAWRIPLAWDKKAVKGYFAAVLGVFGAMFVTYLAAANVPSGLISVIFGLSPMVTGLLAQRVLNEPSFSSMKWGALILSVIGLAVVLLPSQQGEGLSPEQLPSVFMIIFAMCLFSLSAVLVKKVASEQHALAQTVGTLWLSLPFYLVAWLFQGAPMPAVALDDVALQTSLMSILYLAIAGSVIGFVSYYYVLKNMAPSQAALITLITPVLALLLGNYFNNELLPMSALVGIAIILLGLALFQFSERALLVRLKAWFA